jgi:hypothetical protein
VIAVAHADKYKAVQLLQDQMGHVLQIRAENTHLIAALRKVTNAEADAYRAFEGRSSDDGATTILGVPQFGVVLREYVHKVTGERIRLVDVDACRMWRYYVVVGHLPASLWLVADEDLRNEYLPVPSAADTAVLPAVSDGPRVMHRQCEQAHERGEPNKACVLCPPVGVS